MEITGALVLLFLFGVFGWTPMPAAFAVVPRAIAFELKRRDVRAQVYVDASWVNEVKRDMSCARFVIRKC